VAATEKAKKQPIKSRNPKPERKKCHPQWQEGGKKKESKLYVKLQISQKKSKDSACGRVPEKKKRERVCVAKTRTTLQRKKEKKKKVR